tara:strand:+ start:824 stop:1075 length:252 start_codon:yes stop_codon:yes gene_type:complete
MKLLSFFIIFLILAFTISIKLLIANQEIKIKTLNSEIFNIDNKIEKIQADISYVTRPQALKSINKKEFNLSPILQSDIIKIEN